MKNVMMGTYIRGEETHNFNFGTDLSVADKQRFVNSVVSLVVDDENKGYNSILRDLIFNFYVVDMLTDVDTTELKESSFFVNDVEWFLEETNIVDIVKANASPTLFDELSRAVDKSIEYLTGVHPNPLGEALASLVSILEKKVNEFDAGKMMEMAQKLSGMTGEFTIDNIVNAYMNSDLHKKNLKEIDDSKVNNVEIKEPKVDGSGE